MKDIKFSIVMPVYNVEKHLRGAVSSLLCQDYKPFEIILVNDCSTDSSLLIAEELEKENDCVSVVKLPQNGGLSNARNKGFERVQGDYVLFMDSDDKVEPNLLSSIAKTLEENEAGVVLFGLVEDYYDKDGNLAKSYVVKTKEDEFLKSKDEVRKKTIELEKLTLYGYAWNKAYSVKLLKEINIEFETVTLIEDILFNSKVFEELDSLNIISAPLYHYMKRIEDGNLTSKFLPDYFDLNRSRVKLLLSQQKRWGTKSDAVYTALANILVRYTFSALQRNCDPRANMTLKARLAFLKSLYKDELFCELIPFAKGEGLIYKVMVYLLKHRRSILLLLSGKAIYLIKAKLPIIFAKLKSQK